MSIRHSLHAPNHQGIRNQLGYRWFIGFNFSQPIPHYSTSGKNYCSPLYRSNTDVCRRYPYLKQCMESKDCTKRISRHIRANYLKEIERHTEESRRINEQRKETIECVFADLKEKHGIRWTTWRGLNRVTMQAMLTFAAMNLKKLATWLWKSGRPFDKNLWFRSIFTRFNEKLPLRWIASGSMSSV